MSDQPTSIAAADAAGGQFAKAFLPGLVLGLVLGLFIGAWIPPFLGTKPELQPPEANRSPQTPEERHRAEAGEPALSPEEGVEPSHAEGDPAGG
ncbi:MAG: hypothetical protein H6809_06600 [Phycisphaeraceae bacterium]|nr:hypothetical protein [Phycisphaeraceae bacterium]